MIFAFAIAIECCRVVGGVVLEDLGKFNCIEVILLEIGSSWKKEKFLSFLFVYE